MARNRKPGEIPAAAPIGPTGPLVDLLACRSFRIGPAGEQVHRNLRRFGGEVSSEGAAWIGAGRPPEGPTVALADHTGTLGPRSDGFLNNLVPIAALNLSLDALPRKGSLGLVVSTSDEIPNLMPLLHARGIGISWIISVGDGDPADALAFLGGDAATARIAAILPAEADPARLRGVLGVKPTAVLGGGPVCQAIARRAGAQAVQRLDDWLAWLSLLDAGVEGARRWSVFVVGGGQRWVEEEIKAVGLGAAVRSFATAAEADEAARALSQDSAVVWLGPALEASSGPPRLLCDLSQPERLRSLLRALGTAEPVGVPASGKVRIDKSLRERVRADIDKLGEDHVSDHDCKRMLKAYGVRVTRQAPASTPTGAVAIAKQIGLPVVVVNKTERVCRTQPDVRRAAALLLADIPGDNPCIFVRERFADAPRAQVHLSEERGVGWLLHVGDRCALLPLQPADAERLVGATAARRSSDQKALGELLAQIAHAAAEEKLLFSLTLYVGAPEPAVVEAEATAVPHA